MAPKLTVAPEAVVQTPQPVEQKSSNFLTDFAKDLKARLFATALAAMPLASGCCPAPAQTEQANPDGGSGTDRDSAKFTKVTANCDLVRWPDAPNCIEKIPMDDCKVNANIQDNAQTGGQEYTVNSVTCTKKGATQTVSYTCTEANSADSVNPDATGPHSEKFTIRTSAGDKECTQAGQLDPKNEAPELRLDCNFKAE